MHIVVDIGNTNITLAVYAAGEWIREHRLETKMDLPDHYYRQAISNFFLEWDINAYGISQITMSSVVPDLTEKISRVLHSLLDIEPFILGPEVYKRLDMIVPKVYEIGADIVANAYAVKKLVEKDSIVVDFGTALTFTVVDMKSGIAGVTIAPGLRTVIRTLSEATAQLPSVEIVLPDSAIGHSTDTAIRAGTLYGYIGMVKEILQRIKSELPTGYSVICTGGLSKVLKELEPLFDQLNIYHTLDGIRLIGEDYF